MTKKSIYFILIIIVLSIVSCDNNEYPRPKGEVRLEYPTAKYSLLKSDNLHSSFEKNDYANVEYKKQNWDNLNYPNLKATVYLTYRAINNDFKTQINEIQKLTYKHSVKASGIIENPFENRSNNTYGVLYEVTGNAASNIQFYVTDSTKNILSGALYFYTVPNPDSLAPAINYIKKDIVTIMETTKWLK